MSIDVLHALPTWELRELAAALKSGRLTAPFSGLGVGRFCPSGNAASIAEALAGLRESGMTPSQSAILLEGLVADRETHYEAAPDLCELVWTGPEAPGSAERDTAVVVRELFLTAKRTVLVAGYVVYQGKEIFKALAERMDHEAGLSVKLFLNVQRGLKDTSMESEVLWRFSTTFRQEQWPGKRLPEVFYDPRALELDQAKRPSLHAKCIVVDEREVFVSSANFTEAAQLRNIEVGVLLRHPPFARQLAQHFLTLAEAGILRSLPGLGRE